jgi:glycosyltransferase involved in cell wall biosynthesis
MPDISVIIPVFNRAELLSEAIDSVLSQYSVSFEVIVVDDGSTDRSLAVARAYGTCVHVIATRNRGVSQARNTGIGAASAERVFFLDSDDILEPGALCRLMEVASQRGSNCIPVGVAQCFKEKSGVDTWTFPIIGYHRGQKIEKAAVLAQTIPNWLCLYPTHALRSVGGYRPGLQLGEDYDLNAKLVSSGLDFIATGTKVINMRVHTNARLTSAVNRNAYAERFLMYSDQIIANRRLLEDPNALRYKILLARTLWACGRASYRVGFDELGDNYINLAKKLAQHNAESGSILARSLYRFMSPRSVERCLSIIKVISHPHFRRADRGGRS